MRICPNCEAENPLGTVICQTCNKPLTEKSDVKTIMVDTDSGEEALIVPDDFVTTDITEQAALLLVVDFNGKNRTMKLDDFTMNYIVGRYDRSNSHNVDIDLQAVDGHRFGVSRLHARITHNGTTWSIEDLDSSNGTYVNDRKLVGGQPFVIRNGDHLRFGNLTLQVYYVRD